MILCIDSGNSRVKWAFHDGCGWRDGGALTHADLPRLADLAASRPMPEKVMLSNVAGARVGDAIRSALGAWSAVLVEARSEAVRCGVTNHYRDPARLGVDRWCALIGARHLRQAPCIVVLAGTATTVDSLDGAGNFLGGLILPGIEMMRRSLASRTAALALASGQHVDWPRCTDDAIVSGTMEAQLGAIERAYARLPGAGKICLLSGGNAGIIGAALAVPYDVVENLPSEGLSVLARAD